MSDEPKPSTELTEADFERAARALDVEVCAIKAVAEVESAGKGFLPDGRPAILFEAHVFHRETGGRHANAKDRKGVALSSQSWNRALYGATGVNQHERYEDARQLNADAANKAASWGMFQIMGGNHRAAGFGTSQEFVDAMWTGGAGAHLDAFVGFIKANKLDVPLRAKNWAAFAKGYNGPGYAQNAYHTKMAQAYARCKK
jgi:hypothetical protein